MCTHEVSARLWERGGRVTLSADQLKGYLMIGGSALMFGCTGVFVRFATAPASLLLVLRMALAGSMIAIIFAHARWWREVQQKGVPARLIVLGTVDAAQLLMFMLAVRYLDVALAVFLSYLSPIYIAIVAPRLLRQRTEPAVAVALVLAVVGVAVMLVPDLVGGQGQLSVPGVLLGTASGVLLAVFFLLAKDLRHKVSGSTMLISNCAVSSTLVLPLALVQTLAAGYVLTATDLWAALGLAVFSTALGGTIFLHGMRYIRVQHTSIIGLIEPASAPVYALVFLGERPGLWTLVGGALILAAAVVVVLFGSAEEGLAGSPEEAIAEVEALP